MSFSTALTHNDSQAINLPADVLKVEVRAPGQERVISPEGHSWDQFSRQEPQSARTFWLSGPVKPRSSATTYELEIPAGHEHRDLRAQAPSTGGVNSLLISLKNKIRTDSAVRSEQGYVGQIEGTGAGRIILLERQKSASRREVIRFILYLSILLSDTRSTFQSQRVFFIEDAAVPVGLLALVARLQIQVQDFKRLRPYKIQVPGFTALIKPLQRPQVVVGCLTPSMVLGHRANHLRCFGLWQAEVLCKTLALMGNCVHKCLGTEFVPA